MADVGTQVRAVRENGGDATHAWSTGASQGQHTVKLDALRDGLTRLVSCQRLQGEALAHFPISFLLQRDKVRAPVIWQLCAYLSV